MRSPASSSQRAKSVVESFIDSLVGIVEHWGIALLQSSARAFSTHKRNSEWVVLSNKNASRLSYAQPWGQGTIGGTLMMKTSLRLALPQLLVKVMNLPSRLMFARGVSQ